MIRVLQTLAFPLGHDAVLADSRWQMADSKWLPPYHPLSAIRHWLFANLSGRWDSNPRPSPWQGDVLPLNYARSWLYFPAESAESQNRTDDTAIFSRVLYQLSYLGLAFAVTFSLCRAGVILHVEGEIVKQRSKKIFYEDFTSALHQDGLDALESI